MQASRKSILLVQTSRFFTPCLGDSLDRVTVSVAVSDGVIISWSYSPLGRPSQFRGSVFSLSSAIPERKKQHTVNLCKTATLKRPKIGFQEILSLNAGQKYCIYVRPSLSYHLSSLRSLFCLFLTIICHEWATEALGVSCTFQLVRFFISKCRLCDTCKKHFSSPETKAQVRYLYAICRTCSRPFTFSKRFISEISKISWPS